jgi:hypothetical protein
VHSLGIIIWTCVSATIPFDFTEKTSGDIDVKLVREAIATNKMPWNQANERDIHLKRVLGLVASCCNPKPMARPSASEVTSSLWDIMTLPPIDDHIVASTAEEIKARVSGLLNHGSGSAIPLDHTDSERLRSLEDQGDPVAAYLIGRAIWNKQMEPDDDVEELLMLVDARQGIGRTWLIDFE